MRLPLNRSLGSSAVSICGCTILRGTHETDLLDAGMSPAAAAKRWGHDPATMLRKYAKRTGKADAKAAEIIGLLSKGALR